MIRIVVVMIITIAVKTIIDKITLIIIAIVPAVAIARRIARARVVCK